VCFINVLDFGIWIAALVQLFDLRQTSLLRNGS